MSAHDEPQRLAAFNALLAIAAGRKGEAASRLERLIRDDIPGSPLGTAALEAGLWLALDDDPATSYEPLQRALESESP